MKKRIARDSNIKCYYVLYTSSGIPRAQSPKSLLVRAHLAITHNNSRAAAAALHTRPSPVERMSSDAAAGVGVEICEVTGKSQRSMSVCARLMHKQCNVYPLLFRPMNNTRRIRRCAHTPIRERGLLEEKGSASPPAQCSLEELLLICRIF